MEWLMYTMKGDMRGVLEILINMEVDVKVKALPGEGCDSQDDSYTTYDSLSLNIEGENNHDEKRIVGSEKVSQIEYEDSEDPMSIEVSKIWDIQLPVLK